MKKRILSVFMALAMVLSLMPTMAWAAEIPDDFRVGSAKVTGSGTITGDGIEGKVYYDATENILTLEDATIKSDPNVNEAIRTNSGDLTIHLKGNNTVVGQENNGSANYGMYIRGNLTFTGDGSLTASAAKADNGWSVAILAMGNIYVNKDCTITAKGYKAAIYPRGTDDELILNGPEVTVASTNIDGSSPVSYNVSDLKNYTYVKIEPTDTYTVTVNNGTGGKDYAVGESVTITANDPESGKQFKEWTGVDGLTFTSGSATSATATFTMPAQAVTVTATYENIPTTPNIGNADSIFNVEIPFTNVFDCQRNYANVGGTQNCYKFDYPVCAEHSYSNGYRNDKRIDECVPDVKEHPSDYFYMFTKAEDKIIQTLHKKNDSGFTPHTMATDGTVAAYGERCFLLYTHDNVYGTFVSFRDKEYHFHDTSACATSHKYGANTCIPCGCGESFIIGVFDPSIEDMGDLDNIVTPSVTYTVTVNNDGNGSATASPASATEGTTVTLTATPNSGYQFKEWQVVSGGVTISNNTFTMGTANVEVKAIFEVIPTYTVTVSNDGNGTGSASPASAAKDTEVVLSAVPNNGYHFKEWQVVSGDVTISNNKFTMPAGNVEVKAIFEQDAPSTYAITTSTDGNGSATASANSAAAGAEITLTATPNSGYQFKEWQVVSGGVTITDNKFTMPANAVEVKAIFEVIPTTPSTGGSSSKPSYSAKVDKDADLENGDISFSQTRAKANRTVTITVTPDAGYVLDELVILDKDGDEVEFKDNGDGTFTFKMPKGGVEVEPFFVKESVEESEKEETTLVLFIDQKAYLLDDKSYMNDVAPVIKADRTMLPIRLVAETLGAKVTWNEPEQTVTILKDSEKIVIYIGQAFALVNGAPVELDASAYIANDRTYLPVRFVSENLGANVTWDSNAQTVTVVG